MFDKNGLAPGILIDSLVYSSQIGIIARIFVKILNSFWKCLLRPDEVV
jgi:hypothetical protein